MSIIENIIIINNKIEQNKAENKLLRFLFFHKEALVNMIF